MSKQTWYLLGWIGGLIAGTSAGLGHQSNWAYFGPVLGTMIGAGLSVLGFIVCSDEN